MADEVRDIKDMTPNQDTIEFLERLLKEARAGRVRSVVNIIAWEDDQVTSGWAYDRRNSARRLLAELVILEHEFVTNLGLLEGDSVLAEVLRETE